MIVQPARWLLAGSVCFFLAGLSSAWSPETRLRMADEAIRLMPASLRSALERQREELRRGVLTPMVREDSPEHKPESGGGSLHLSVAREARGLLEELGRPSPFGEIALRFGRLAHFVLDAGFPPGMSATDGEVRYDHFAGFCESRLDRFPLVFYGHEQAALARGEFREFAREVIRRARNEDRELARAYAAAGNPPSPAAFDDRSVPFAVGSLAYSRSVTDLTRAWIAVWKMASGDLGRTPYSGLKGR